MSESRKIEEIFSGELKELVKNKLETMVKDAAQKINKEDAAHLVNRILYFLKNRFRYITWMKVCEAFDEGVVGKYGASKLITVNNLTYWLYRKVKEEQELNRGSRANDENYYCDYDEIKHNTPVGEFMVFARLKANIDVNNIDPEHRPEVTKTISPEVARLTNEFVEAKKTNSLEQFRMKLNKAYAE